MKGDTSSITLLNLENPKNPFVKLLLPDPVGQIVQYKLQIVLASRVIVLGKNLTNFLCSKRLYK